MPSIRLLGILALLVSSCTGTIGSDGHQIGPAAGSGASVGPVGSGGSTGSTGPTGSAGSIGSSGGAGQLTPLVVGASVVHRLTPVEYSNTIRDLLGATVDTTTLPADIGDHGFSKDSAAQGTSSNTVSAFKQVAGQVIDSVFASATLKANLVKCGLTTGAACIKSTLQAFVPNAWRRAVQSTEIDDLMVLVSTAAAAGDSAEDQLKLALQAVLTSSKFLYLIEKNTSSTDTAPKPISDYELASRLSYFIWSSTPDAQLLMLASQGKLQDDATLAAQLTRMLQDPKASAMTDVFASDWMALAMVPQASPDAKKFPLVTDALKQSMVLQSKTFFKYVLTNSVPISDLVDSTYTFVDAGLGKLYGLPAPAGTGMSKVSVEGTTRAGGVLGQSSILMQYASQVRSSPVKRGNWVLNNLLCAPVPPPPPAVMAINAANAADPNFAMKAATQTWRERLEEHRATDASCNTCHSRIDPLGLALESYNAVGQYQTIDDVANKPIDPSGQLVANDPSTAFTDVAGMTRALAKDNRISRCMVQLFLTFGLGRVPTDSEVTYAAKQLNGNSDTLVKAIAAVVTSASFRQRAGSGT